MSHGENIERVVVDKEGHDIVIHDADEARLAALGKKRFPFTFKTNNRGDGAKLQHIFHARDVLLHYCNGISHLISRLTISGKRFLPSWLQG